MFQPNILYSGKESVYYHVIEKSGYAKNEKGFLALYYDNLISLTKTLGVLYFLYSPNLSRLELTNQDPEILDRDFL